MNTEKIKFAKESIAKLREKILVGSTTNRNKLINFKHQDKKRDQVRVVDASINQIYSDLSEKISFSNQFRKKKEIQKTNNHKIF